MDAVRKNRVGWWNHHRRDGTTRCDRVWNESLVRSQSDRAERVEYRSATAEGHTGERDHEQVGDHISVAGHPGLQALHLGSLLGSGRATRRGDSGAEFLDSLACWPLSV